MTTLVGQRGIGRAELHVDQPAVANRRDRQLLEERVDRLRLRRRLVGRRHLERSARLPSTNSPVTQPRGTGRRRLHARRTLIRLLGAEQRDGPTASGSRSSCARAPATLQDVVLRLVVVGLGLVLVDDFLEETTFGFSASISSRVRASKIGVAVKV